MVGVSVMRAVCAILTDQYPLALAHLLSLVLLSSWGF